MNARGHSRRTSTNDTVCQLRNKVCVIVAIGDPANDVIDDCIIPSITTMEMLECTPGLKHILKQCLSENLIWQKVHTYHYIPTSDAPACESATLTHFNTLQRGSRFSQIQSMLANCIIEESSSPWMPLAVFVKKENGRHLWFRLQRS